MMKGWLAICMVALFLWSGAADARRVALVIGNANYSETGSLANPANDAEAVAQSARQAGFDEVVVARNINMQDFQDKLRDFRQMATGADLAMVYYAGHGIESRGENWLIPVDAKLKSSFDLPYESINLDRVMESLEGSTIRMVVLDACRNNPFGKEWRSGTRGVKQGLAGVEADDVLLIYAAAPGQTAEDGTSQNSPFAASLAKRLIQPDLPIQMLGGSVRDDVLAATGGKQRPYVSASITGTPVYLVKSAPKPVVTAAVPAASPIAPAGSNRSRLDALSWRGALSANSSSAYSAYLTEFPSGLFADLAKDKINELRQPIVSGRTTRASSLASTPVSPPVRQPTPVPAPVVSAPPQLALAATPTTLSNPPTEPTPTPEAPSVEPGDGEVKMERSAADLAYVAPKVDEPPLPTLPPTPVLRQEDYPDCKEDHQHLVDPLDKANEINRCTVKLDQYYTDVLNKYRETMNAHQDQLSSIFTEKVAGRMEFSAANRQRFYDEMMQEHSASNPEGANLAVYRGAVELYESDRNYLRDRFCFNTGCAGYEMPDDFGRNLGETKGGGDEVEVAANGKKSKKKKKSSKQCKKSRGRGQLLGGIFGGLAGKAAGLGNVGSLLAGGFGALLVGEIACQLDEKEQEEAAEATETVTKEEKVGAVATWQSPTRAGVSGSSTVTALNTRPNGNKCLTITDVAFIDGEETRVSKQMCRSANGGRYSIMA